MAVVVRKKGRKKSFFMLLILLIIAVVLAYSQLFYRSERVDNGKWIATAGADKTVELWEIIK